MNAGHRRPNSNDSTVPVTAPTANVTAATFDQRWASSSASASSSAQAAVVGDQHHRREGDAERGQDDVEAQRERHLAARGAELDEASVRTELSIDRSGGHRTDSTLGGGRSTLASSPSITCAPRVAGARGEPVDEHLACDCPARRRGSRGGRRDTWRGPGGRRA